jgi:hypothetical protein
MTARSVAAMYGAGLGPDETPHVEQTVDGEEYMVDVDLTPAADILLQALATAIGADESLAEWFVRLADPSTSEDLRDVALGEILASRPMRRALTLRFAPLTADALGRALDDAALLPARCEGWAQGDPCGNYAAPGERQCPRHLPADLVEEYHL